jgi:hypothetical protein
VRMILVAIIAALALGAVASFVLNGEQRSAYEAYSTSSTRVGDPGENLVGRDWHGLKKPGNG